MLKTVISLQRLVLIQKRTSPIKFAHLTEKSEKGSISNLSTKAGSEDGQAGAVRDVQGNEGARCT